MVFVALKPPLMQALNNEYGRLLQKIRIIDSGQTLCLAH